MMCGMLFLGSIFLIIPYLAADSTDSEKQATKEGVRCETNPASSNFKNHPLIAEPPMKKNQSEDKIEASNKIDSSKIKKILGEEFDPTKKYIIAIQGVTTSGKTTLSSCLFNMLNNNNSKLKPLRISTDHFYKNNPFENRSKEEIEKYDFDNPKSIDWDSMKKCITGILKGNQTYLKSSYCFISKLKKEVETENPGFNVIILEGIFAHNLFNDKCYNLSELDAFDTEKKIKVPLIENDFVKNLGDNVKIIKIFMDLNRETMLETRKKVDFIRSNWNAEKSVENFKKKILPATSKWVMPSNKVDVFIEDGSRDLDFCTSLINELMNFFEVGKNTESVRNELDKLIKDMHDLMAIK